MKAKSEGQHNKSTRFSLRLCEKKKLFPPPKTERRDLRSKQKTTTFMPNVEEKAGMSSLAAQGELAELIKVLTLRNEASVSAESFEKIIPHYDGKTMPIKQWFKNFESNADAYDLNDKQKYVHARNKMVDTAKLFLESVTISDYKTLKQEMCNEFHKDFDSAEIHEMLRKRKIKENESFCEYVLQVKKMAALGKIEESAIIKYVVEGLTLENSAKYLLYSSKSFKELYANYEIIDKLAKQKGENKNSVKADNNKRAVHCFNCGSTSHKRSECKSNTKCFKCNQSGHMAKTCPQLVKNVNHVVNHKRGKNIILNGVVVDCLIDTGADVTIVKKTIFEKLNNTILQKSSTILRGLGSIKTHPVGEFTGNICVDGIQTSQKIVVVPDTALEYEALLGFDFIRKFRITRDENGFEFSALLPTGQNVEQNQLSIYNIIESNTDIDIPPRHNQAVQRMIDEYKPEGQEKCPITLKIVPDGEISRFRHAPSRLPAEEADAVKKQVNEWLKEGIVRKSSSHIASRVVVVKKKDATFRVCVDFRKLNSMVLKDCFPVPIMDDVFDKLQSARFFTVMDLENGFFHVPVEEESRKFTAFITKEGLFEFNVAPFGFCNSPAVFIRFVNYIFQDLINENIMELYMDDIIIFVVTADECIIKMKSVLQKAAKYNLKIKWKKCHFLQTKINFLGHVIESGRIRPGREKTNAVYNFKTPTNVKAVQSFLGLTGFFRKFIPGYAGIARPLTNLLRKDAVFNIGPAELYAIQELKECLTKEPLLKIYSRDTPTELHTDASKDGFGAALLQVFEDTLHPVFFWSKRTSVQEAQRHSYILEVKAAFLALKKFRHYLLGTHFKLVTDCAAFKYTTNKKDIPREVTQWILYMQDFTFTTEHRAGERLKHVDFLSRYPQDILLISSEVSARMKKAQEKDDHVKAVKKILESCPYEDFKVKGGLLYKAVEGNDVLVVPKAMEAELIKDAHNVGHFAAKKTMHTLQQNFWIPHLENKVSKIISNCVRCIMHNKKLGKKEGFLNYIEKGDIPLQTLHIDHLGPMDATAKQYKFIFALVDAFSKFIWLYPTKSTGCDEVIRKLTEWTNIFGNPTRLVSDRGSAFTAKAFTDFTEAKSIEHVLTTTGVARGNGQIERMNRTILSIIAKLSSDNTSKWFKFVPQVQTAINSHTNCSSGKSPFELMFGIKMNSTVTDKVLQLLESESADNFDSERRKMREDAKMQIQRAQAVYKRNYDRNRKVEWSYSVGDLVAIRRTQFVAGKKLASEYLGPYEMTKVKGNSRYDVKKAAPGEGPNTTSTSGDNLKLWRYIETNEEALSSGSDDEIQDDRV